MGFSAGCYPNFDFTIPVRVKQVRCRVDPILNAEGLVGDSGCSLTDSMRDGADGHAHHNEQVEAPMDESSEPSSGASRPHAQPQQEEKEEQEECEDKPEFSAPQMKYVMRLTLEQCCEQMKCDIDIDGLLAHMAEVAPILQSEADELIASKSETRWVINSLCEQVAKANCLGDSDRGNMALVAHEAAESSMRETTRSNASQKHGSTVKSCGQASTRLRTDPGFGRGPSRTPKKKRS